MSKESKKRCMTEEEEREAFKRFKAELLEMAKRESYILAQMMD